MIKINRINEKAELVPLNINKYLSENEINEVLEIYDQIEGKYEMDGNFYRKYLNGSYKIIIEPESERWFFTRAKITYIVRNVNYIENDN